MSERFTKLRAWAATAYNASCAAMIVFLTVLVVASFVARIDDPSRQMNVAIILGCVIVSASIVWAAKHMAKHPGVLIVRSDCAESLTVESNKMVMLISPDDFAKGGTFKSVPVKSAGQPTKGPDHG